MILCLKFQNKRKNRNGCSKNDCKDSNCFPKLLFQPGVLIFPSSILMKQSILYVLMQNKADPGTKFPLILRKPLNGLVSLKLRGNRCQVQEHNTTVKWSIIISKKNGKTKASFS